MKLPTEKRKPKASADGAMFLLYGPTKVGKSTFVSNVEECLFIDTEAGLDFLEVYQASAPTWKDLLEICAELAKGQHQFKAIAIDTLDIAYKLCLEWVCAKHGAKHPNDIGGHGHGWGLINTEFYRVLHRLKHMNLSVWLIAHQKEMEIEPKYGKRYTQIVPNLSSSARELVLGLVDVVLFADVEIRKDSDGNAEYGRILRCQADPRHVAGGRAGHLPAKLPLNFAAFQAALTKNQKENGNE